jgi:hypothetical protein
VARALEARVLRRTWSSKNAETAVSILSPPPPPSALSTRLDSPRRLHLLEQQGGRLVTPRFQSRHAAERKMCDRLEHPRQPLRDPFDVRVERDISAASCFSERPECALRGTGMALLEQKHAGPRRVQPLGDCDRAVKITVKTVADNHHGLHRSLPRLLQRLLENVADLDEAAADAPRPAPVYEIRQITGRPWPSAWR